MELQTDSHIPGNVCIGLGKQLDIVGVSEYKRENGRGNFLQYGGRLCETAAENYLVRLTS